MLWGVWGSSGSDVFAVGGPGTILHYDGSTGPPCSFERNHRFLKGVWGSSGSDVFVVGEFGTILHYNGSTWSSMDSGAVGMLYAVWGSSGSDVFVVGDNGTILPYNGSTWSSMSSGTTEILYGIWGSSGSDVFAVGNYGTIFHYNGSTWSSMASGTVIGLGGVWGSSGSDVFAVGPPGTILHYNGSTWSSMPSGATEPSRGVWGSSGSDVFAVGYGGTILHYDGSTWSSMASGTTNTFYGVWGSSGSDVFAVGDSGTILHYQGSALLIPEIKCSLSSLTVSCTQGVSPLSQSFQIWNSGSGTLDYTLSTNQSWITCAQPSGSSTGASDKKTLTFNYIASGLAAGSYQATITIMASGASNSPLKIPVTLTVNVPSNPASSAISDSPSSLSASCAQGSNASSQTFEVWNSRDRNTQLYHHLQPDLALLHPIERYFNRRSWYYNRYICLLRPFCGDYSATITISSSGASNTP